MPRPTKLSPALTKKICKLIEQGTFFKHACILSSISEATGYAWMQRGKLGEPEYLEFLESIKRSEAISESNAIARILESANGHTVTTFKRKQVLAGDGITELHESIQSTVSSWQAVAWYLERKFPAKWGRSRVDELEAVQILIKAGWLDDEVIGAIAQAFDDGTQNAFVGRIKEIFAANAMHLSASGQRSQVWCSRW
jgi:hypothetical protein